MPVIHDKNKLSGEAKFWLAFWILFGVFAVLYAVAKNAAGVC